MKFNDYASMVISAGYDRSVRAWDCRSQSTEPIQVYPHFLTCYSCFTFFMLSHA